MSVTFDALAPSLLDGVVRRAPVAPTVERIRQRIAAVDATPGLVLAIQVVASLTGLWLTRHGLTTTTPAGADIYGHVARTDFALEELFPSGRLDGWFPGLGSGYRLFAVNGPGLAVLAGLVRLVTLGAADTAQAFGILGSLSIAALPWAVAGLSRELGATRLASAFHGLLALFVSFYAGGGLAGLYGPGLIAQTLALPLQVAALAVVIRAMRHGGRRTVERAALVVAALALLHPISIVVLACFAPLGLAGDSFRRPGRRLLRGAAVGVWAAAWVGFWLVPAVRWRELQGDATAWAIPPLPTRLAEVWRGDVLWPGPVALAAWAAASVTVALAVTRALPEVGGSAASSVSGGPEWSSGRIRPSWRWRRLGNWPDPVRRLRPFAAAAVFLIVAHLAVRHRYGPYELAIQLPTRGLALAAVLALQPLAELLGDAVVLLRRLWSSMPLLAGAALALTVPWQLDGILDPRQVALPPASSLERAAVRLDDLVPPMGRHLLVTPTPYAVVGTDQPSRWLAVASDTNSAHLYFWEATRENTAGVLAADLVGRIPPQDATPTLRRAGVTHVVVTTPEQGAALAAANGFRLVWTDPADPAVAIYEVSAAPGPFPTAALLQPAATEPTALRATPIVQEPEHLVWEVDTAAAIDFVAAVAYDPTWEVAVDGGRRVPVERSTEGLTRFTVPAGQHYVTLRFTDTHPDPLGVGLTALAFTGLIARHRLTLRPTLSPVARTHSRHPEGADG